MTILAKSFSEKKGDKLVVPLVDNEQLPPPTAPEDVEACDGEHHPRIIIFPARDRISAATTLCLLLTALAVVGVGIIGGKLLYNEYFSVESHAKNYQLPQHLNDKGSFLGFAKVPLDDNYFDESDSDANFPGSENWPVNDNTDIRRILKDFLPESFEINDERKYEKIDVPDFRDGRSGRFIHDFNTNMTGIIDVTGHRCFVMSLDRQNVLPPKSLFDLIQKMWEGYYKVDTDLVRKSMRVVLPALEDTDSIGTYIANECADLPIYRLERVDKIVKRSLDLPSEAKFAQFAGKGITEIDIVNLDEVIAYEKKLSSH